MTEPRIAIAALPCPGRHGAYPGERDATRTFLVDLEFDGAGAPAIETACDAARRAVAGGSYALLERVADAVARGVLDALPAIGEVRVRVAKPDPPGLGAALEAVTLTCRRSV